MLRGFCWSLEFGVWVRGVYFKDYFYGGESWDLVDVLWILILFGLLSNFEN